MDDRGAALVRWRIASWSARLLRGKAPDADEMALVASRTGPETVGARVAGGWTGGHGSPRCCRAVELQQEARLGGLFAPGMVPQAEVADLVQTLGQDVLQEPAHELVARDAAGSPAVGFAVLVADGDGLVVEADDAGVGDGDAEHVAGEVVEHGLLAVSPGRAMDDLGFGPSCGGEDQVRTARREAGPELAAHELGERLDGCKRRLETA